LATHYFVSIMFARSKPGLAITTLVGKTVVCKRVVCKCSVSICESVLPANLVVLPIFSYHVILGMDWLVRHSAIIDYAQKQVKLKPWEKEKVTYVGLRVRSLPSTIFVIRARKLIIERGQAFLAFVVAPVNEEKKDLQDIPMVQEYSNVFSIDYSGLPP
jgi:hypothetical protein